MMKARRNAVVRAVYLAAGGFYMKKHDVRNAGRSFEIAFPSKPGGGSCFAWPVQQAELSDYLERGEFTEGGDVD